MYQNLEPEPEGAICPKRSMPQSLLSSPHDTLPVCLRLESFIQGTATPAGSRWANDVRSRNPSTTKEQVGNNFPVSRLNAS